MNLEPLEERALPSFLAAVNATVGDPYGNLSMAVGDFTGNGKQDLVAPAQTLGGVSVALGNGNGTFQPARVIPVAGAPSGVAVGEFTGDGKLDIATIDNYYGQVNVLLGNGDGTFQAPRSFQLPLNQVPLAVAVGDLNDDGNADLVILGANESYYGTGTDYVNVLLGHGDGTFSDNYTAQLPAFDSVEPPLALGDFQGDGKLDVATGDSAGIQILKGNGDGTLGAPSTIDTGGAGINLAVGDFRGDGRLDLATLSGGTTLDAPGTVSILLGDGDGTFQAARTYAVGVDPVSLAVADFNRDGKADLAAANYGFNGANASVSVLLGNGDGTFQNALSYAAGPYPEAVVAADFNGDGFPDLAVANNGSNSVPVLLNAADWSAPQASSFAVSGFPSPTTAGAAGNFTVTVKYAGGATDANYTGTVHFTSSDPQAVLPADYTFTAADAGVHTFRATLKTAGTQSLTATDFTTGSVSGTDAGITVNAAAASTLSVAGFPSPSTAGVAGNFTVTARDPYGNIATGYTGTVHFTSSDSKASLPPNYTFTAADAGVHTFSATLRTAGTQSITATDVAATSIAGADAGITVNPGTAGFGCSNRAPGSSRSSILLPGDGRS